MKIFPFENFEIKSAKSVEETYSRIDVIVLARELHDGRQDTLFGKRGSVRFDGERSASDFVMYRRISYRSSFSPIAFGRVVQTASGCTIRITVRMHMAVTILMFFWLSFAAMGGVVMPLTADR